VHAVPEELLRSVEGKVWEVVITSSELTELKQTHVVGSTTRNGEGVRVRVVGDCAPGAKAQQLKPTLEDAYLHLLAANHGVQERE